MPRGKGLNIIIVKSLTFDYLIGLINPEDMKSLVYSPLDLCSIHGSKQAQRSMLIVLYGHAASAYGSHT